LSTTAGKKTAQWRADQVHAQPPDSHLQKFLEDLWSAVRAETEGRLDVTVHPYSMDVPGAGPNVVKKVVAGEIEFHVLMGGVLGQVVPAMEIQGLPFAYTSSEQVARIMDGALGEYLRSEMAAKGLYAFPGGLMENGFRQMVSVGKPVVNAGDLEGYRMRVPAGRVFSDLFDSLGAIPVTVNIDRLYASLRDGEVDGQENPLVVTEENKLYEVSTRVSVTNHMWSGFNLYGNLAFWNALPRDVQEIVERNVRKFVLKQRDNVRRLNKALETRLVERGMTFNTADIASFRRRLGDGFYARWKAELGQTAWTLLENEIGPLA
jgi:tripartite ATP-independent transporter DctP family solute receptor